MSPGDQKSNRSVKKGLILGCILIPLCLSLAVIVAGTILIVSNRIIDKRQETSLANATEQLKKNWPTLEPAPTSTSPQTKVPDPVITERPPFEFASPSPEIMMTTVAEMSPTATPEKSVIEPVLALDYASVLLEAEYPPRDYYESAKRLSQIDLGSRTVEAKVYVVGDIETFSTGESEIEAVLMAITEHAYYWFETSLNIGQQRIENASERFEQEYYPRVTELFGQEWLPGVDNDPRFTILHLATYTGGDELGFFTSGNEYPITVFEASNEREMFYLNMANLRLGSPLYFGTLVHEYLHLIQWHIDPNEAIWFSEGLAQYIELYSGLDTVDSDLDYAAIPSVQLNSWNYDDQEMLLAHYGAAYLFTVYIWEQLGELALTNMLSHPADGLAALYNALSSYQPERSLDQFFADWLIANFLDIEGEPGKYGYRTIDPPQPIFVEEITELPAQYEARLFPFSADYISLSTSGEININFQGDPESALFPELPYEGDWAWFVPGVNEIDAKLTTTIHLPDSDESILSFWTWHELEKDFDFAYLTVSTDEGETWQVVTPEHAQQGQFGPAFGGKSESYNDQVAGWVKETVSLWRYSGQDVMIRFEVLTDSTIAEGGFAVGGITFDAGVDTWKQEWNNEGFVQTSAVLPRNWSVQLIQLVDEAEIIPMVLDSENNGSLQIALGEEDAVLVVSALGPVFGKKADYQIMIEVVTE